MMQVTDIRPHRGEFFTVLQQTKQSQAAVMTLAPGQDAGPEEVHDGDQVIYVVEGEALVRVGDIIPSGPGMLSSHSAFESCEARSLVLASFRSAEAVLLETM